jgi:hypothetical protein
MRDSRGRFTKQIKATVPAISQAPPPTFRTTWRLHATVIGLAIAWHFAAVWIVLAAIIVSPFILLWWLERTGHYTAARFLYGFLIGLLGWRRW